MAQPTNNDEAQATPGVKTPIVVALAIIGIIALAAVAFYVSRSLASGGESQTSAEQEVDYGSPSDAVPPQEGELAKLALSVPTREPNDPRALGKTDAPVVMTEFSDYSCPMCTKFTLETFPALQKFVDDGTLRIEYRDFPIFANEHNSNLGALGGLAAAKQGKFWDFFTIAAHQSASGHAQWTDDLVMEVAKEAKIPDMNKFSADYHNPELQKQLEEENNFARQLGLGGTPAFFINDRYISGALPTQAFISTIEAAANDAKK